MQGRCAHGWAHSREKKFSYRQVQVHMYVLALSSAALKIHWSGSVATAQSRTCIHVAFVQVHVCCMRIYTRATHMRHACQMCAKHV